MKKRISLVLVMAIMFGLGAVSGHKAAMNKLVSEISPMKGFEQSFEQWKEKYGVSTDSMQFYKIAELNTLFNQVVNQHAKIINQKADANDVKNLDTRLAMMECSVAELMGYHSNEFGSFYVPVPDSEKAK